MSEVSLPTDSLSQIHEKVNCLLRCPCAAVMYLPCGKRDEVIIHAQSAHHVRRTHHAAGASRSVKWNTSLKKARFRVLFFLFLFAEQTVEDLVEEHHNKAQEAGVVLVAIGT